MRASVAALALALLMRVGSAMGANSTAFPTFKVLMVPAGAYSHIVLQATIGLELIKRGHVRATCLVYTHAQLAR